MNFETFLFFTKCLYCQECGGDVRFDAGTIYSPNFPQNYLNNLDCMWTVSTPNDTEVYLIFDDTFGIESEPTGRTCYDFVFVHPLSQSEEIMFCGENHNLAFFDNSSAIRNNDRMNFRGLHLVKFTPYSGII